MIILRFKSNLSKLYEIVLLVLLYHYVICALFNSVHIEAIGSRPVINTLMFAECPGLDMAIGAPTLEVLIDAYRPINMTCF